MGSLFVFKMTTEALLKLKKRVPKKATGED